MMFLPPHLRRTSAASPASGDWQSVQADQATLAQRVARGERTALEDIYRSEAGPVYRYALALCGNPAWAADATQEAFINFALHARGFDAARGSLGAYLAGMARHCLLAMWRQQRHEVPVEGLDDWVDGRDDSGSVAHNAAAATAAASSPEQLLVQAQHGEQQTTALWAALRHLPLPLCEALVLVDLQERPYAEAARIAGVPLNTLRTRLHRARLRLVALLQPHSRDHQQHQHPRQEPT
jgi:RNA polymerase sigma-70 factor, ECF subfamily